MSLCPDCGEELDDFGPCGCLGALPVRAQRRRPLTELEQTKLDIAAGGMRAMVARKMARQRGQS